MLLRGQMMRNRMAYALRQNALHIYAEVVRFIISLRGVLWRLGWDRSHAEYVSPLV
jgi:hypothetical protein